MPLPFSSFAEPVRTILAQLDGRPFPLVRAVSSEGVRELEGKSARDLFPSGRHPDEALSGLFLRLNQWDKSHELSQELNTSEGSYWHGIAHRLETDYGNAVYWFRRVGEHAIFPRLHAQAADILSEHRTPWHLKSEWDPLLFSQWCEQAARSGDRDKEAAALAIQKAEWELLFEWCGARI